MDTKNESVNPETALVIYTKFNGDISNAIQKTTALKEINPQNRIVVEGGMYLASVSNLKLETAGFTGFLHLAYYQEMTKDTEQALQSLSMMVLDKFLKRVKGKHDIIHEGKKYKRVWKLWSSDSPSGHWIILHGDISRDAIGKMKVQLLEKRELLFSNGFLDALFSPVVNSLRDAYAALGRF